MKKIFITGGSGTVGSSFIEQYLGEYKFYSYSRNEKMQVSLKRKFPDIEIILGSVEDYLMLHTSIAKVNPDIIFSTHSHLNAIICLIKKVKLINSKVVIRESNFLSIQQGSSKSFYVKNIVTWLIKQAYPVADHIICQTEEMKKDFLEALKNY